MTPAPLLAPYAATLLGWPETATFSGADFCALSSLTDRITAYLGVTWPHPRTTLAIACACNGLESSVRSNLRRLCNAGIVIRRSRKRGQRAVFLLARWKAQP